MERVKESFLVESAGGGTRLASKALAAYYLLDPR
jgi:hypothetical protein